MNGFLCVIDPKGWHGWTNNRETAAKWAMARTGSLVWGLDDKLWRWVGPWPGIWQLMDDPATHGYGAPR